MPTNRRPPRRSSLRGLARELGVTHGSLSAAIAAGRLRSGIGRDDRGQTTVIDADAASAEWRCIHVPRLSVTIARMPAARQDALHDVAHDCWTTAPELFAERDALSLLASAMVADALMSCDAAALKARIAARLRDVAELHGADDDDTEDASRQLELTIGLLRDCGEPDA